MTNKQLRTYIRYVHLLEGILIAIYIYSPTAQQSPIYSGMVQLVIVPFIVISGLALWQQPRINKWWRQFAGAAS